MRACVWTLTLVSCVVVGVVVICLPQLLAGRAQVLVIYEKTSAACTVHVHTLIALGSTRFTLCSPHCRVNLFIRFVLWRAHRGAACEAILRCVGVLSCSLSADNLLSAGIRRPCIGQPASAEAVLWKAAA